MAQLSTSDLVAIGIGVVQLIAAVALAVWTIRRTKPSPNAAATDTNKFTRWSLLRAWVKSSWLFVVFLTFAVYQVWALTSGTEELSKSFVLKIALYCAYGTLNAVAAIAFFVIEFQMDVNIRLAGVVQEINLVQGRSIKSQEGTLAIIKHLLAEHTGKRRRHK